MKLILPAAAGVVALAAVLVLPAAPAAADPFQVQFRMSVDNLTPDPGDTNTITMNAVNSGSDPVTTEFIVSIAYLEFNATVGIPSPLIHDVASHAIRWIPTIPANGQVSVSFTAELFGSVKRGSLFVLPMVSTNPGPSCVPELCYALFEVSPVFGQEEPTPAESLPKTGFEVTPVVVGAAGLLALGALLLVGRLRRAQPARRSR